MLINNDPFKKGPMVVKVDGIDMESRVISSGMDNLIRQSPPQYKPQMLSNRAPIAIPPGAQVNNSLIPRNVPSDSRNYQIGKASELRWQGGPQSQVDKTLKVSPELIVKESAADSPRKNILQKKSSVEIKGKNDFESDKSHNALDFLGNRNLHNLREKTLLFVKTADLKNLYLIEPLIKNYLGSDSSLLRLLAEYYGEESVATFFSITPQNIRACSQPSSSSLFNTERDLNVSPELIRYRFQQIFNHYDPSKLPLVDNILTNNKGREKTFLSLLTKFYSNSSKRNLLTAENSTLRTNTNNAANDQGLRVTEQYSEFGFSEGGVPSDVPSPTFGVNQSNPEIMGNNLHKGTTSSDKGVFLNSASIKHTAIPIFRDLLLTDSNSDSETIAPNREKVTSSKEVERVDQFRSISSPVVTKPTKYKPENEARKTEINSMSMRSPASKGSPKNNFLDKGAETHASSDRFPNTNSKAISPISFSGQSSDSKTQKLVASISQKPRSESLDKLMDFNKGKFSSKSTKFVDARVPSEGVNDTIPFPNRVTESTLSFQENSMPISRSEDRSSVSLPFYDQMLSVNINSKESKLEEKTAFSSVAKTSSKMSVPSKKCGRSNSMVLSKQVNSPLSGASSQGSKQNRILPINHTARTPQMGWSNPSRAQHYKHHYDHSPKLSTASPYGLSRSQTHNQLNNELKSYQHLSGENHQMGDSRLRVSLLNQNNSDYLSNELNPLDGEKELSCKNRSLQGGKKSEDVCNPCKCHHHSGNLESLRLDEYSNSWLDGKFNQGIDDSKGKMIRGKPITSKSSGSELEVSKNSIPRCAFCQHQDTCSQCDRLIQRFISNKGFKSKALSSAPLTTIWPFDRPRMKTPENPSHSFMQKRNKVIQNLGKITGQEKFITNSTYQPPVEKHHLDMFSQGLLSRILGGSPNNTKKLSTSPSSVTDLSPNPVKTDISSSARRSTQLPNRIANSPTLVQSTPRASSEHISTRIFNSLSSDRGRKLDGSGVKYSKNSCHPYAPQTVYTKSSSLRAVSPFSFKKSQRTSSPKPFISPQDNNKKISSKFMRSGNSLASKQRSQFNDRNSSMYQRENVNDFSGYHHSEFARSLLTGKNFMKNDKLKCSGSLTPHNLSSRRSLSSVSSRSRLHDNIPSDHHSERFLLMSPTLENDGDNEEKELHSNYQRIKTSEISNSALNSQAQLSSSYLKDTFCITESGIPLRIVNLRRAFRPVLASPVSKSTKPLANKHKNSRVHSGRSYSHPIKPCSKFYQPQSTMRAATPPHQWLERSLNVDRVTHHRNIKSPGVIELSDASYHIPFSFFSSFRMADSTRPSPWACAGDMPRGVHPISPLWIRKFEMASKELKGKLGPDEEIRLDENGNLLLIIKDKPTGMAARQQRELSTRLAKPKSVYFLNET